MTIFSFDEPGKWFDIEGGGRLQLKSMTPDRHKEIRKSTVKRRVEHKKVEGTPARFDVEETNEDLANELFWDFVIVAWENFFDANGTEIPCTKENKMLLITKSTKFTKYVTDCLKDLADAEAEDTRVEEKNSLPGLTGTTVSPGAISKKKMER